MDLSMPVLDGVEATRRIVAADPDAHVVVLTSFGDNRRILDALDAGASGYLLKHAEPDELLAAIRAAAAGDAPLDPKAARVLLDERRGLGADARTLSPREEEVLRLVAAGPANKQIARQLGISERTVKAHLTNVFARIGVTDRTQAALWAERTSGKPPRRPARRSVVAAVAARAAGRRHRCRPEPWPPDPWSSPPAVVRAVAAGPRGRRAACRRCRRRRRPSRDRSWPRVPGSCSPAGAVVAVVGATVVTVVLVDEVVVPHRPSA